MNNRNVDFPVSSKRRKELEEALFRESMGLDEEETFQQVLGQQQLEDRTQSWQSPVDTAIPVPTAVPVDPAVEQRRLGGERLAEMGELWRGIPGNLQDLVSQIGLGQIDPQTRQEMGAGTATDIGRPLGALGKTALEGVQFGAEITSAYGGPAVAAAGVGQIDPMEQQVIGGITGTEPAVPPSEFIEEQMAQVRENITDRPLSESLGEHLQRPLEQRLALEILLDPLNLPLGLIATAGIRAPIWLKRLAQALGPVADRHFSERYRCCRQYI